MTDSLSRRPVFAPSCRARASRALLLVGVAALALGCSTKVEDCNKVIDVHNANADAVKKVSMEKPEGFDALADILEKTSKEIVALSLSDEATKTKVAAMTEPDKAAVDALRVTGKSMKKLNELSESLKTQSDPDAMTKKAAELEAAAKALEKQNKALEDANTAKSKAWDDFHGFCTK
jgi:hypothetical protein